MSHRGQYRRLVVHVDPRAWSTRQRLPSRKFIHFEPSETHRSSVVSVLVCVLVCQSFFCRPFIVSQINPEISQARVYTRDAQMWLCVYARLCNDKQYE